MKKKLVILFSAIVLVFTFCVLFCVSTSAATYSGNCGNAIWGYDGETGIISGAYHFEDNVTWTLDSDSGILEITGNGEIGSSTVSGYFNLYGGWCQFETQAPWYELRSYIRTVRIGEGVTSIGARSFRDCEALTEITFASSVNSIGDFAFFGCCGLVDVMISDQVQSIGDSAFEGCWRIKEMTIGNGVTKIGEDAFNGCAAMQRFTIGDSSVAIPASAFLNCVSLNYISFGDHATVTGANAFADTKFYKTASNWENGTLYYGSILLKANPNAAGEFVIKPGTRFIADYAFQNNTKLTKIVFPQGLLHIGLRSFSGCTGLTEITLPDSVISIGKSAFYECSNLQRFHAGIGVADIGLYAFYGCNRLTDLTLPVIGNQEYPFFAYIFGAKDKDDQGNWVPALLKNVTILRCEKIPDYAFYGCRNLQSITYPDSVTSIGNYAFYNCKNLTGITIPDSVTSIGKWAFCNCTSLTSITIPDSVTSIGDFAFDGCTSLKSITIPDSVTSIGSCAFNHCTSLTSITIPDSVTSINSITFGDCTSLTSITIPNSVTSIGKWAFCNCTSLTSITIPDSVTSISQEMFRGCTSLASITIPGSVTSIDRDAFSGCTSLTNITIPNSVTSIGDGVFSGCTSLTSITLPDSVTSIGSGAFYGTGYYNEEKNWINGVLYINGYLIRAKDTVSGSYFVKDGTKLIANEAFESCKDLTDIVLSETVTSIGDSAFAYCSGLKSILLSGSVTTIGIGASSCCYSLKTIYNLSDLTLKCGRGFAQYATEILGAVEYCAAHGHTPVIFDGEMFCKYCGRQMGEFRGTCGDLAWTYDPLNEVLTITGNGAIPDYSADSKAPWSSYAKYIKTITLEEGVTVVGEYAFADCTSLTEIVIAASLTEIHGNAFPQKAVMKAVRISDLAAWCRIAFTGLSENPLFYGGVLYLNGEKLTEVTIPDGVTSIAVGAFYGQTSVKSVRIPAGVTEIGASAFSGCTELRDLVIPHGVTVIRSLAFSFCPRLSSVMFPEGLTTIGYAAFYGDTALTEVMLPTTLKRIGTDAFVGCTALKKVTNLSALGIIAGSSEHGGVAQYADTVINMLRDGFVTVDGEWYYYQNGKPFYGWIVADGMTCYADPESGIIRKEPQYIAEAFFFWDDEIGLTIANGFYQTSNGTICYENGRQVIGWRHADGTGPAVGADGISEQYSENPNNLYYFLSTTGCMVTSKTYKLGGFMREFNDDHTVKPLNGLQNRYGELYYYVDGVIQTGWHTIDGKTYYFRASDDVYGRAATKWMYIGNKIYYFCASNSDYPYTLKTSGTIGGITYTFAEDGHILYNGFVNCEYANAANSNTALNIQKKNATTRYFVNGVMQTGWQVINGKHYYFYLVGSENGSGYMCTTSRKIGGVWYEFNEYGVCTNKQ